jgi:trafficking protein particle complex subunit 13
LPLYIKYTLTLHIQVTNPLSVKTKVHTPRSPSALLSATEGEKVFLEVHIQNLTPENMWFERMHFECVEGWQAQDINGLDSDEKENISAASIAVMRPQDMRQYIYVLSPKTIPSFPITHSPGSIVPLGRLDISWRTAFGEPGRLLTSVGLYHSPHIISAK